MSLQCSSGPIRSSHPCHIARVGIQTISGYTFASDESNSDNVEGDPEKPQTSLNCIRPTGSVVGQVDGTDDEVDCYASHQGS